MWIVRPLNDSVETLAPDASPCLVARSRTSSIFFSFSPASARRTPSTGRPEASAFFARGVLGDGGDGKRSLGKLDQVGEAHTDLFLEVLGGLGQLLAELVAESL